MRGRAAADIRARAPKGKSRRAEPATVGWRRTGMRLFAAASGLLAVGAAVALAGCGVAPTSVSKPVSVSVSVSAGHTAGPASPRAALSHEQRAVADANAILASFAVPPGARKLPAAPTVGGGVLKQPEQVPSTPDLVDKSGWWLAVGAPRQVL